MKYLDKLKKERSIDRVIFLAGMVLAFIGFLIPTVYVKMVTAEPVDNTVESADLLDDDVQGSQMGDDDFYNSIINGNYEEEDESSEGEIELSDDAVVILKETVTDFVLDKNYEQILDGKGNPKKVTNVNYSFVAPYELESNQHVQNKLLNIFGICGALNVAPYAYNATFLVIVWLCSIAGIFLFLTTKTIVGDIVTVLLGLAFAIASAIAVPLTLKVFPVAGYMTIGGYLVLIGWILGIIGSVLGAAHIQHPSQINTAK